MVEKNGVKNNGDYEVEFDEKDIDKRIEFEKKSVIIYNDK